MDLILGLACDGRAYPDFPGDAEGALHAAVVGLSGLIDILEVQLGLTGPRGAEAVRIAAYAAKLRAATAVNGAPFYAASFARDPWATAKTLLGWRDQLIAAGWRGEANGSPRLDDLARTVSAGPSLPAGSTDRLCAVLTALSDQPAITIDHIRLVEPRQVLPPPYRRLVDQLERCGTVIGHLLAELARFASFDQMVAWTREPRPMPVLTFGKHRGQPWAQVPSDYLQWMISQTDMDADTVWHARRALAQRI